MLSHDPAIPDQVSSTKSIQLRAKAYEVYRDASNNADEFDMVKLVSSASSNPNKQIAEARFVYLNGIPDLFVYLRGKKDLIKYLSNLGLA